MKKGGIIAAEGVIAAALIVACGFVYLSKDRRGPEISFSDKKITCTDSTDIKDLLKGVTASDDRDGDVTSTVRVTSVIPNEDNTEITVEYTAKDRSNNVTRKSHMYHYSGTGNLSGLTDPTSRQIQHKKEDAEGSAAESMAPSGNELSSESISETISAAGIN